MCVLDRDPTPHEQAELDNSQFVVSGYTQVHSAVGDPWPVPLPCRFTKEHSPHRTQANKTTGLMAVGVVNGMKFWSSSLSPAQRDALQKKEKQPNFLKRQHSGVINIFTADGACSIQGEEKHMPTNWTKSHSSMSIGMMSGSTSGSVRVK